MTKPTIDEDMELEVIGFKVTKEMKRELKIEAAKTGKTVREILEKLIQEHLAKSKQVSEK